MMSVLGDGGGFTNKSPRYASIQRMIQAGVPTAVGMAITGHRNENSYRRYDQSLEIQKMAAMNIIAEPFKDGKRRKYENVLNELEGVDVQCELTGSVPRYCGNSSAENSTSVQVPLDAIMSNLNVTKVVDVGVKLNDNVSKLQVDSITNHCCSGRQSVDCNHAVGVQQIGSAEKVDAASVSEEALDPNDLVNPSRMARGTKSSWLLSYRFFHNK